MLSCCRHFVFSWSSSCHERNGNPVLTVQSPTTRSNVFRNDKRGAVASAEDLVGSANGLGIAEEPLALGVHLEPGADGDLGFRPVDAIDGQVLQETFEGFQ